MAYKFENALKTWADNGAKTAPSEQLRVSGFEVGMKPPASLFNYQWDKLIRAILELQKYTSENLQTQIDSKADGDHTHDEYATKKDLEGLGGGGSGEVGEHTHDEYATWVYVDELVGDIEQALAAL